MLTAFHPPNVTFPKCPAPFASPGVVLLLCFVMPLLSDGGQVAQLEQRAYTAQQRWLTRKGGGWLQRQAEFTAMPCFLGSFPGVLELNRESHLRKSI